MLKLAERVRAFLGAPGPRPPDAFLESVALFRARAARWNPPASTANGPRIGVLITPWLSTAVPFFSLECAALLRREGRTAVLLFDDTDLVQNSTRPSHSAALRELFAHEFTGGELHFAERATPQPSANDATLAEPIFRENAIWRSRGEDRAAGFMADNDTSATKISAHLARVRRLLTDAKLDGLLIPGGMFGLSAVYVAVARELGLHFATYDGSAGFLRLAQDGVAAHLADLPQSFAELRRTLSREARTAVQSRAAAELDDRLHVRDPRQFQVAAVSGRTDLRYDLLVPLNIRWDSAALGRQRAFATVADWLDSLLTWVSSQPAVSICIRQHPRERLTFAKGSDDLAPLLAKHAALGSRLRFVAAAESISTYDLLPHCSAVLPHTSTVGIEAAMLGKPVVLATHVYYDGFGFCQKPATCEDYFAQLSTALAGQIEVTAAQRDDAALAYYLTQCCALLSTPFTAHPDDFRQWVDIAPDDLWARPELADFRTALLGGEPLSLVRHRRLSHAA